MIAAQAHQPLRPGATIERSRQFSSPSSSGAGWTPAAHRWVPHAVTIPGGWVGGRTPCCGRAPRTFFEPIADAPAFFAWLGRYRLFSNALKARERFFDRPSCPGLAANSRQGRTDRWPAKTSWARPRPGPASILADSRRPHLTGASRQTGCWPRPWWVAGMAGLGLQPAARRAPPNCASCPSAG